MTLELRVNPWTDQVAVIATDRQKRPRDFSQTTVEPLDGAEMCPFCPGHESETPPEIDRDGNADPWRVRVVPNKFPAFIEPTSSQARLEAPYPLSAQAAHGYHDVVVSTPDHTARPWQLSADQWQRVLTVCQRRMQVLADRPGVAAVLLTENSGPRAGASRSHSHLQITAFPIVPPAIRRELSCAERHRAERGGCLMCTMIVTEREVRSRVVFDTGRFVSFAPHASRLPWEVWLCPAVHAAHFGALDAADRAELGSHLQRLLQTMAARLDGPPYNMVLRTAPVGLGSADYHWHLEVLPRLTVQAGIEWGAGVYVNPVDPDTVAHDLGDRDG